MLGKMFGFTNVHHSILAYRSATVVSFVMNCFTRMRFDPRACLVNGRWRDTFAFGSRWFPASLQENSRSLLSLEIEPAHFFPQSCAGNPKQRGGLTDFAAGLPDSFFDLQPFGPLPSLRKTRNAIAWIF
jgi:hypothetical protein